MSVINDIDLTPITRLEYDIDAILNDHAVAEPITRIELILADIVAGNTTTVEPVTRIETYLAIISGADYPVPEPVTRIETFLAIIAGEDYEEPEAVTRLEGLLAEWVEKGSGIWKTVTGTLIHLADALASPMQKCEVTLEPIQSGSGDPSPTNVRPITGWTGCEVTRTGKNLYNPNAVTDNSYLSTTTGLPEAQVGYVVSDYIPVIKNQGVIIPASGTARRWFYDKNKNPVTYLNNSSNQLFTPSDDGFIRVSVSKTSIFYNTYIIAYGSGSVPSEGLPTEYEPYNGTTLSVTFPDSAGTVYGGTVDLVSGVLTVNRVGNTRLLSEFDKVEELANTVHYRFFDNFFGNNVGLVNNNSKAICNIAKYIYASGDETHFYLNSSNNRIELWVPIGIETSTEIQIIAELQTPITYQLTPQQISTLKGENNVWSNTNGDTTVIYKAQAE